MGRSRSKGKHKKRNPRYLMKGGAICYDQYGNITEYGQLMKQRIKIFLIMSSMDGWNKGTDFINDLLGVDVMPSIQDMLVAMATGGYKTIDAMYGGGKFLATICAKALNAAATGGGGPAYRAAISLLQFLGSLGLRGAAFLGNNPQNIASGASLLIVGLVGLGIPYSVVQEAFINAGGAAAGAVAGGWQGVTGAVMQGQEMAQPHLASALHILGQAGPDPREAAGAAGVVGNFALDSAAVVSVNFDSVAVAIMHQIEKVHDKLPVLTLVLLATSDAVINSAKQGWNPQPIINVATQAAELGLRWSYSTAGAVCAAGKARAASVGDSAMDILRRTAQAMGNWMIDVRGGFNLRWHGAEARAQMRQTMQAQAYGHGADQGAQAAAHAAAAAAGRQFEEDLQAQAGALVAPPNTPIPPPSPQAMYIRFDPLPEPRDQRSAETLPLEETAEVLAVLLTSPEPIQNAANTPAHTAHNYASTQPAAYGLEGAPSDVYGSNAVLMAAQGLVDLQGSQDPQGSQAEGSQAEGSQEGGGLYLQEIKESANKSAIEWLEDTLQSCRRKPPPPLPPRKFQAKKGVPFMRSINRFKQQQDEQKSNKIAKALAVNATSGGKRHTKKHHKRKTHKRNNKKHHKSQRRHKKSKKH